MEEKKLTDEELNELIKKLEYQSWAQNCHELSQAAYMLKCQKVEIERLTEEKERMQIDLDNYHKIWKEKLEENYQLQKQVDELKKSQVVHIHIDDKLQKEYEYELKQAVKDTAKEILQGIMNIIKKSNGFLCEEVIRIMAKQNGVEVE